jgi:transmembrane sensor
MTLPPKPPIQLPEAHRSHDPLRDEALAWIAHLHSGNETEKDWALFESWRRFDEAHGKAADKAEKLWQRLGPALTQGKGRRGPPIISLVVAALCLAGIAFASVVFGPVSSYFAEYQTSVGEIRSVMLRDGSSVDLDTATSFDVDIEHRNISLYAGQIFVAVKPDPTRPFSVRAGDITVRALGTAFIVRRDAEKTTVVVTESAVSVSHGATSFRAMAGQSITYSSSLGLQQPKAAAVERFTAWRNGELVFDGQPLGDVVREMERYRRGKIIILDDAARRLPVSGVFDARDSDTLFESFQLALPVKILRIPGLAVVQSSGSSFPR